MLSYLNDPKLKTAMVAEMEKHQKQDAIIKGTYAQQNGMFKGCAVGCAVQSLNISRGLHIQHDDHASLAEAIQIPEWLWRLQDGLFENLPEPLNSQFAVDFIKAIPVGIDLEPVKWKFCAFILKENIERVLLLKIDAKLKEQVVTAIKGVLDLHEKAVMSGKWDESAWSAAESAAESAAGSAAESAAWSAESAARSAAESAARSAAYERYAKELLRLLKAEKGTERKKR